MTHEERAWSVIDKLRDGWCYGPCGVQAGCGCSLAIVDALRTVELEAYERAAKVAETPVEDDDRIDRQVRWDVAQAIRSLAVKEGER
jgi:hypothetical protein